MRNVAQRLLIVLFASLAFVAGAAPNAAAGECDLYSLSSTCLFTGGNIATNGTVAGGTAQFQVLTDTSVVQPTGTGYIDSFLRVQMKGYEEGFNTSARPALCDGVDCDIKTDPNYTRTLLLSDVPIVKLSDGNYYRQFFLDINEPTADPKNYLTLDQIEIYTSNTANLSAFYDTTLGPNNQYGLYGATKIWDMDTAVNPNAPTPGEDWINLNYGLMGGGSGKGDMVMYIPNQYFLNQTYVYLYSQFGCITKGSNKTCGTQGSGGDKYGDLYPSQAGFEEWWVYDKNGGGTGPLTAVPEPASLTLLATGLAIAVRRRSKAKGSK